MSNYSFIPAGNYAAHDAGVRGKTELQVEALPVLMGWQQLALDIAGTKTDGLIDLVEDYRIEDTYKLIPPAAQILLDIIGEADRQQMGFMDELSTDKQRLRDYCEIGLQFLIDEHFRDDVDQDKLITTVIERDAELFKEIASGLAQVERLYNRSPLIYSVPVTHTTIERMTAPGWGEKELRQRLELDPDLGLIGLRPFTHSRMSRAFIETAIGRIISEDLIIDNGTGNKSHLFLALRRALSDVPPAEKAKIPKEEYLQNILGLTEDEARHFFGVDTGMPTPNRLASIWASLKRITSSIGEEGWKHHLDESTRALYNFRWQIVQPPLPSPTNHDGKLPNVHIGTIFGWMAGLHPVDRRPHTPRSTGRNPTPSQT